MTEIWFERLPLAALFFLTVVIVLASITIGYRVGLRRRKRTENEGEGPVGSVVGAVLGLLAFIMAFTFGIAASRFDARKQLLLDEVNAIGTAVRRADLLPEPHRTESRRLLKQYVDIRADLARQTMNIPQAIAASEALHDELWSHAVALARADLNSDIGALFVEALNQVIDLHTSRVTVALQYRIPVHIWMGLLLVTVLSMVAVGYQFGLSGRTNTLMHLVLALTFSAVILLIADLDRATQGALQVSQEPMLKLQEALSKTEP
jgi:CDP-diglyceride synthetase